MKNVIIFSAGGTGGHMFPACALALELQNKGQKIQLITDLRGKKFVKKEFDKVTILPVARLDFWYFLKSPYLLFKSFLEVSRADKVVCFGGYTSLFPFLAAMILGKERVIYQLDSHVTRLNRVLLPFASKVFYAFAQTNFKNREKALCFGIPVREGFEFSFIKKSGDMNIAIIGGSLGSNYWKELLMNTLALIPENIRKHLNFQIQTKESVDFIREFNVKSVQCQEFYDTATLFAQSHLIIARAGATSIAEISSIARPVYLVPWEKSLENHQYKNAKNYADFKGAEFGYDPQKLANYIVKLFESDDFFYKTCQNAASALPQFAKNKASSFILNRY